MGKRDSLLKFIKILSEKSDEEHPLRPSELARLYHTYYNEKITRQTITKYVEALEKEGYDVVKNGSAIYLANRILSQEEVELLCHSIMANNTIPLSYSKELIEKLLSTQSDYFKENNNLDFNMINDGKKNNKEIYLNIRIITEAIQKSKMISFEYTRYDENKELVKRREDRYEVIPYRTVCKDSKMFLICKHLRHDNFINYRIDRMRDIKVHKRVNIDNSINPYEYVKHRLYMYNGDINEYTIQFDDIMLDEVIDLFGKDIEIKKIDDNYITNVKTTEIAMIYFACQYINHVVVLKPETIRKKIKHTLKESLRKYD